MAVNKEWTPKRLFAVNLYLNSKSYLSTNYGSLLLCSLLAMTPLVIRRARMVRFNLPSSSKLMSNQEVVNLIERHNQVYLRLKVIGLCPVKRTFHCVHQPFFTTLDTNVS